jgi:hypothetical protein
MENQDPGLAPDCAWSQLPADLLIGIFMALDVLTIGMVKDVDGQRLRRWPNISAVGVGYISGSPRSWPSA